MKEKSNAFPFLAAAASKHQEQKEIGPTDWRLQGRHHTVHFTNATELPTSKTGKGNTQGQLSFCGHHPQYCCWDTCKGCAAAATSAHGANEGFSAICCDKQGLFHGLPSAQKAKKQRSGTGVPLAREPLYLCLWGRCRPFLLTSYLGLNANPTAWWKSQSSNSNVWWLKKQLERKNRPLQERPELRD